MSCVCVLKLCSLKKKQPHISDADCDVYCGQNAIFILAKKSFPYFGSSHIQNLLRALSSAISVINMDNGYYLKIPILLNRISTIGGGGVGESKKSKILSK